MEIIKRSQVGHIDSNCGKLQELFSSANMSISYLTATGKSVSHMHREMEEVYFIIKGMGKITIGNETREIEKDDVISIPKGVPHSIESVGNEPLELLVVTHPMFNQSDVIEV